MALKGRAPFNSCGTGAFEIIPLYPVKCSLLVFLNRHLDSVSSTAIVMGIPQDEVDLPDTLGLTLTAGMLPHMTLYSFPGQTPIVPFTPSTRYDFTNPTTTTKHLQISSTTKASQSSHIVIPLYAVVPLPSHQVRAPPPQPVPSPHPLGPAFWDVVERTVDYSVHGTLAMVWLLLAIAEAISQKVRRAETFFGPGRRLIPYHLQDLAFLRDSQTSSSCDPFDLDSLPFIPTEDDLLRVDVSGLESIPSSELYLGEEDLMAAAPATPRPVYFIT